MAKGKVADWITDNGLLLLEGYARDGLNDEQIAEKIGISRSTYYEWLRKYPSISDAIKKGKAPVDYKVENALLNHALGYKVKVKKAIKLKTKRQLKDKGTIEEERIEYADEEIYIPPDTTAQIYWLKNRRRGIWCDRPEITEDIDALKKAKEILGGVNSAID